MTATRRRPWRGAAKRLSILAVLAAGLAAFFAAGLHEQLSFEALQENREMLTSWVEENLLAALLAYVAGYAVVIAFSLPVGAVATISGGFFFGLWFGAAATVIGATAGRHGPVRRRPDRAGRPPQGEGRGCARAHGQRFPAERLQLPSRAEAGAALPLFPRQYRGRLSPMSGSRPMSPPPSSASFPAPSSIQASATGWGRSSTAAGSRTWGLSWNRKSCCRSWASRCWPWCRWSTGACDAARRAA